MNLTAYLIGVITFLVIIFTTAGLTIRNRNSSITSILDQGYKPIMFTDFTLPKNNKRIQKRSAKDDDIINGSEENVEENISLIEENIEAHKEIIANTKFKLDISSLASLSLDESTKFLEYFEKDTSEIIKAEEQQTVVLKRIFHQINQKFRTILGEYKIKREVLENFRKNAGVIDIKFEKFWKENENKILINHPNYDQKAVDEYFELLAEELKGLQILYSLTKHFYFSNKKVGQTLNQMFQIFFYDYKFDLERFDKEILKEVLDSFYQNKQEDYVEDPRIEKIFKKEKAKKESLEISYLKGQISEEFYLKRKEHDEKVVEIMNKIFDLVNLMNSENCKSNPEECRVHRFLERLKIILERNE
ncbi:hypothetical protein TUBRATIS_001110 [Tubulinosema ratisbonensis]|uniref:Uncharacterized protein n=1 Tax=Tubulinosema ratisbonensis TaxID=291195 RepID=A0A437AQ92_9MICR|nr:hypothetical protein TUBRATIS_001110 [Tubulinosema ratisbonensis]